MKGAESTLGTLLVILDIARSARLPMPKPRNGSSALLMMAALGVMAELGERTDTGFIAKVVIAQTEEERQTRLKEAQDKRDRRNAKRRGAI